MKREPFVIVKPLYADRGLVYAAPSTGASMAAISRRSGVILIAAGGGACLHYDSGQAWLKGPATCPFKSKHEVIP